MRRAYVWAAGVVFLLSLFMNACGRSLTHARELVTATPLPPVPPAPTPGRMAVPLPVTTSSTPVPTPSFLPTVVPQTTPVPTLASVPTIASRPTPVPTPFPDAQQVVDAILGVGTSEHWASYRVGGSFTARGADEQLALVGNIGDYNEVRWVVVAQVDESWRLIGTSECLGSGLDAPPSFDLPPELLDFDDDGRQEMLSHCSRAQGDWKISTDTLYRWDGHALVPVWTAPTVMDTAVFTLTPSLSLPGRGSRRLQVEYRAEWEWVDLDGEGLDEILLRDHVVFHEPREEGGAKGSAAGVREEGGKRASRWDGEAFRPYAPDGPDAAFAYVAQGDVWLWQDHAARPLGAEHVREMCWSPDGRRISWWSRPPDQGGDAILGVYDLTTGVRRTFSLEDAPSVLHWTPDGQLAYAFPDQLPVLLDPQSGQQEPLPVATLGAWSPDGSRMAYERDGSLVVYGFSTRQERALVVAPTEGGSTVPEVALPDLAWSPRGDWIACYLSGGDSVQVGLIAPGLAEPVSALDFLEPLGGWDVTVLQFAWSPDGSHLAALATVPSSARRPVGLGETSMNSVESLSRVAHSGRRAVLYLAEMPPGEGEPVGRPAWKEVLGLASVPHAFGLAWSPDGERVALAAGTELWEVTAAGETTLRHRFLFPRPMWKTLEWAPDGSGVLVGLESARQGRLYWFPACGGERVLLLTDALDSAQWAPQTIGAQARSEDVPSIVLVEYGRTTPRLHFVGGDGSDAVVRTKGTNHCTPFQIGGQRVYYYSHYADRRRVFSLRVPDVPGNCQPPLVSADGRRLAWLCADGPPDWQAVVEGRAEIHFRLIVTDGQGRDPREVWHRVETGPDFRLVHPVGWGADGATVYLSRPKYGAAWAHFEYNPGILALDVNTGRATPVGDLHGVHDGLVSADGVWLVQSRIAEWPERGVSVTLNSLVEGTARAVACAPEAVVAGDFSFSPDNVWLAWREWARGPGGSRFTIRALRLPDGEPFAVYDDAADIAPRIGGWLRRDDLVLVYPLRQDGTGEYSTVVTLPTTGPGYPFSRFVFLGVLAEDP